MPTLWLQKRQYGSKDDTEMTPRRPWRGPHFGFRVSGSGFRVSGCGFRVSGSGFRVSGSGFRVSGSEIRVPGSGLRVPGFGIRVSGFGFRDPGTDLVIFLDQRVVHLGLELHNLVVDEGLPTQRESV